MKKSSTALAALVAVAGLAGASAVSAHANPAHHQPHAMTSQMSRAASARLHALLETPGSAQHQPIRVDDWGAVSH